MILPIPRMADSTVHDGLYLSRNATTVLHFITISDWRYMSLARWDLLQFLRHAAHASHPVRGPSSPIYVLGNPSADLDSIISAILYSYLASSSATARTRQYVPLINLPDVRSGKELWRLRPEFATALRLATSSAADSKGTNHAQSAEDALSEKTILTVADFREQFYAKRKAERQEKDAASDTAPARGGTIDVLMVDWNALPLTPDNGNNEHGVRSGSYENIPMSILGSIDHHQDESFIPPRPDDRLHLYEPRCIQTGVGSCTSLVVRELRSRGIWIDAPQQAEVESSERADMNHAKKSTNVDSRLIEDREAQAAKLALAAILADTANMTAESKVSDADRAAVSFLERKVVGAATSNDAHDEWDRQSFYEEIMHAKENSVENLTMDEILGRDYKEWTEASQTNNSVKIGFCNVVKPLSWILRKASQEPGSSSPTHTSPHQPDGLEPYGLIFTHLSAFSRARGLDVVVLMTIFTGPPPDKEFNRELLIWDLNGTYKSDLQHFETVAAKELGLVPWIPGEHCDAGTRATISAPDTLSPSVCGSGYRGVWKQTDVSKSRKQVAPLVRNALSRALSP